MSKGLPLAKPAQAGLLTSGKIWQCFGNAIGIEQTQDFVLTPGGEAATDGSPNPKTPPKNLVLNWRKGMLLSDALKQALHTAYPDFPATVNIDSSIVAPQDQVGYHANIEQLGYFVRRISQQIKGGSSYPGVSIVLHGGKFNVFDGSAPQAAGGAIAYTDLIGNPTWIAPFVMQIKTVMRADIHVGQTITLPRTLVTRTQAGFSPFSNQGLTFQGSFNVNSIRHVGNFRQPDAASWVSIIDAASQNT